MRIFADRLGKQAALIETDISRGRADQARHRVALHVLRHIEAQQFDAEAVRELPGDLGFTYAGRSGEQKRADRLLGLTQAGARHLDRRCQRIDGLVLPKNNQLQITLEGAQQITIGRGNALRRYARHLRDDALDLGDVDNLRTPLRRIEP